MATTINIDKNTIISKIEYSYNDGKDWHLHGWDLRVDFEGGVENSFSLTYKSRRTKVRVSQAIKEGFKGFSIDPTILSNP